MFEEVPEDMSSILQTEQEDVLEPGASEAEIMVYKPQETFEIQPADESSKPLEDEQPTHGSKVAKQESVKVKHYLEKHYLENRVMRVEDVQV